MDNDDLADVEALLRQRIGLNPEAVHRDHIASAVRQRMAACGLTTLAQYRKRLEGSVAELQELIEGLVVVESWFFRDVQPFRFLERFVRTEWMAQCQDRALRLLSVPCGAGEEPYSLAMTLLNMGMDAERFRVDGIDISRRALQRAREAAYGESSFRERDEPVADFRSRYFRSAGTRMIVDRAVQATVRFRSANLAEPAFLRDEPPYDVIFCRNLLIYFDADARRTALANLHRLLDADGVLYVGHVEGAMLRGEAFEQYDAAYPFAFRGRRLKDAVVASAEIAACEPILAPSPIGHAATAFTPVADPPVTLETARAAADHGRLDEAAARCLTLLAKAPPNADVFCLLGVIRQSQGDAAEAEKCFHKALYLDPRHHESLVHIALLASRRGDETIARNYRRRADNITPLSPGTPGERGWG